MKITQRKLYHRAGSEGPAYDPYGFEERTVWLNGVKHTLHTGLGVWYRCGGDLYQCNTEEATVAKWETAVGMTVDVFDRSHDRLHPYFDDPMGSLSMYE
jgi:hypothetical protein